MRKLLNKVFNRIVITALIILLQIWVIVYEIMFVYKKYTQVLGYAFTLISIIICVIILYKDLNPAVKLAWIVPILLFPILGGLLYLMFGHVFIRPKLRKNMDSVDGLVRSNMIQNKTILVSLSAEDKDISTQCNYISTYAPAPVWKNTDTIYFDDGKPYLDNLLEDLRKAEKFIFVEYFIISLGNMWSQILDVLKEKAAAGVDVRLMYDDFGSAMVLPNKYYREMEQNGIKCVCFNRISPFFSIILNNRDHRKVVVIDGKVGYTGGINLADEYINERPRFGYWKDAGLRLEGDAVWNMTVMFLQMWGVAGLIEDDFSKFKPQVSDPVYIDNGYVQPYGDSPLDKELVGENVYLNIINNSKEYLWIYTPYLIIDNVLMEALKLACKRGVDVRIVTPGIPDKKMVFYMTRCSYKPLMDVGARIYEYTPGFIHAKCTICDDEVVDIGTVNYDYRSLYHHFECGVFMYHTSVTQALKEDMLHTFTECEEITEEFLAKKRLNIRTAMVGPLLHLFAPLL